MQVPELFYEGFASADLKLRAAIRRRRTSAFTRAALAMCENIDWNVGRLLDRLDELKLSDNTIVIYFSDNGPNSWRWNGGMKGRKGSTDEGGVRAPFPDPLARAIPAGARIRQIAGAIDSSLPWPTSRTSQLPLSNPWTRQPETAPARHRKGLA